MLKKLLLSLVTECELTLSLLTISLVVFFERAPLRFGSGLRCERYGFFVKFMV